MSDSKNHPLDRNQINLNEARELQFWTKELTATKEEIQMAVKNVGTSAAAVRRHLKINADKKNT